MKSNWFFLIKMLFILFYFFTCSGNFGPAVTLEKLKDFHRRRLQLLVEAGADLLAFETIPNKLEAQVCSCTFYGWLTDF